MKLSACGPWQVLEPVGEDGSSRRYSRVAWNNKTVILMECSGPEMPGHAMQDFVRIAEWLNGVGLKAPEIYEQGDNYLLIEDFGDTSLKKALEQGGDVKELYHLAADVLTHLSKQTCSLFLPNYYQSHVHKGHRRVIDWYLPIIKQKKNEDGIAEKYLNAWKQIEKSLPLCPQGFLHIDFHAENLMWLPNQNDLQRCGILDFQGAMTGPLPYDLANLLEDPRREIPEDLRNEILKPHDDVYRAWYRVLGTQFHGRVIGQYIRLAMVQKKPRYLQYIPAVERYLREALKDPLLAPLKAFFSDIKLDFRGVNDLNPRLNMELIRSDAF